MRLGWDAAQLASWRALGVGERPARVVRLDRGWSTALVAVDEPPLRVRNIGADVAVGDFVVPDPDGERVAHVLPRTSAFVRRASFEGSRAEAHTIAANIDVVVLVHGLSTPPNERRLERELVLAWDSGADPVVVLTKADLVDETSARASEEVIAGVTPDVPVLVTSAVTGRGVDGVRDLVRGGKTLAFLGASGVGKSTLVNVLVGHGAQRTADVRTGDQRGRHTTIAAELVPLDGGGWLLDTPGVRAVSLWSSGRGIERAFSDIFAIAEKCRFRDCKHDDEPGCAVQAAVTSGALDDRRLMSMKRLVAEEHALEDEQFDHERRLDRRGVRRPRPR